MTTTLGEDLGIEAISCTPTQVTLVINSRSPLPTHGIVAGLIGLLARAGRKEGAYQPILVGTFCVVPEGKTCLLIEMDDEGFGLFRYHDGTTRLWHPSLVRRATQAEITADMSEALNR